MNIPAPLQPVHVIGSAAAGRLTAPAATLTGRNPGLPAWTHIPVPGHAGVTRPYGHLAGGEDPFDALDRVIDEAVTEAGLDQSQRRRAPVLLGTSSLDIGRDEEKLAAAVAQGRRPPVLEDARWGRMLAAVCRRHGINGPQYTINTACSSSANALLYAQRLLSLDLAPAVIVLGFEGFNRVSVGGFHSLMLLAQDAYRPFDRRRDGIILAEGAAAAVLSRDDSRSRVRIEGGHSAIDPTGVTVASRESLEAVMREALGTNPEQRAEIRASIRAVKAHGTGTDGNDSAEARAIDEVFDGTPPPYFSLKGALGHTMGACGLLELSALAGVSGNGVLPASTGCEQPDPELPQAPLDAPMSFGGGRLLLNYFGFGGNNTSLVVTL